MALRLFFDSFSQPCRAVMLLLEANKIPYQKVVVNIAKGEQQSNEELRRINPTKSVPTMDDNGFGLYESGAIMAYLVDKYHLPDHWYPKDLQKRAKVDEYLHWHHNYLRWVARSFYMRYLQPKITGREPSAELLEMSERTKKQSLKILNGYFLKDTTFILSSEISIADLQALCELTQSWILGEPLEAEYPNMDRWVTDCKDQLGTHFDAVHKFVYFARDSNFFGSSKL